MLALYRVLFVTERNVITITLGICSINLFSLGLDHLLCRNIKPIIGCIYRFAMLLLCQIFLGIEDSFRAEVANSHEVLYVISSLDLSDANLPKFETAGRTF